MLAFSTKQVIKDGIRNLPNFSCVGLTVHGCFGVCGKPSGIGRKMGKWGYFSNVGHRCQFQIILGRPQVIKGQGVYAMVLLCRGEPVVYKGGGSWGVVAQVVIPVRQGVNAVPNGLAANL